MHQLPGPILPPLAKVVIHDPPWRQVMGQQAPGAAAAQDIEDGVQDFPFGILLWAAPRLGCGHIGGNQRPFLVSEVGRVRCSGCHAANGNAPYSVIASFLNTLLEPRTVIVNDVKTGGALDVVEVILKPLYVTFPASSLRLGLRSTDYSSGRLHGFSLIASLSPLLVRMIRLSASCIHGFMRFGHYGLEQA